MEKNNEAKDVKKVKKPRTNTVKEQPKKADKPVNAAKKEPKKVEVKKEAPAKIKNDVIVEPKKEETKQEFKAEVKKEIAVVKNNYATSGMVLGIVSLFVHVFGLISLIGLILSIVGYKKSKEIHVGEGRAVTGIICNSVALFLEIVVGTILLTLILAAFSPCSMMCSPFMLF